MDVEMADMHWAEEIATVFADEAAQMQIDTGGFALLLAVVDTSVFISGHTVIKRLVETMAALDDPVRSAEGGPFQLRIQVVVPFKVLNELGGLAEGRGTGATEQRTLDAKGALRWIREMRDGQEQGVGLGRLLKFLVFQKRYEYEQALAFKVPEARPDDQILRCCLQQKLRARQAKTNESREVVLLSNDKGQLQDGEVAWELQGAQLRSFVWEDHSAVLQRYFNHSAPQQTPARPAPSARLPSSNPLSYNSNQAPLVNSDQDRIQHGAMRISQVLATGLSPVLQFVLERTYDGLDPDVLNGMFDNAPPYKHMDQLLQALQPKSKMWEDLKMYCSNKHEVDTAVRILRGCSTRLERMDSEPRFITEVAGAALTCLRAFSNATSKALPDASKAEREVVEAKASADMHLSDSISIVTAAQRAVLTSPQPPARQPLPRSCSAPYQVANPRAGAPMHHHAEQTGSAPTATTTTVQAARQGASQQALYRLSGTSGADADSISLAGATIAGRGVPPAPQLQQNGSGSLSRSGTGSGHLFSPLEQQQILQQQENYQQQQRKQQRQQQQQAELQQSHQQSLLQQVENQQQQQQQQQHSQQQHQQQHLHPHLQQQLPPQHRQQQQQLPPQQQQNPQQHRPQQQQSVASSHSLLVSAAAQVHLSPLNSPLVVQTAAFDTSGSTARQLAYTNESLAAGSTPSFGAAAQAPSSQATAGSSSLLHAMAVHFAPLTGSSLQELLRRASELLWGVGDRAAVLIQMPDVRNAMSSEALREAGVTAMRMADALEIAHKYAVQLGKDTSHLPRDTLLAAKAAQILRERVTAVAELSSGIPNNCEAATNGYAEEAVKWQAQQALEDISWLSDERNAGLMCDAEQYLLNASSALLSVCEGM